MAKCTKESWFRNRGMKRSRYKSKVKICDALWTEAIKKRDKVCKRPNCPFCFNQKGTGYLQSHHIVERTCWPLRYDIKNGVLLCRPSHKFWSHSNDPFVRAEVHKFYENFTDMKYLELARYRQSKNDYAAIEIMLKSGSNVLNKQIKGN